MKIFLPLILSYKLKEGNSLYVSCTYFGIAAKILFIYISLLGRNMVMISKLMALTWIMG